MMNSDLNKSHGSETKEEKNFISILLKSDVYRNMPEKQLIEEIATFILTGSETTAITVCFTLLMLAKHSDIQERVHEELNSLFVNNDRRAELEDLRQLTFLECCIKETLRRFPPAPFIERTAMEDIELEDGKVLPRGSTILLPIFALHLNKEVFENPGEWRPDRFETEEIGKLHRASFVPFATGPRSCIGERYAMLAIKAILCALLRKYQFTTNLQDLKDIKFGFDIVLRNYSGYRVIMRPRYP